MARTLVRHRPTAGSVTAASSAVHLCRVADPSSVRLHRRLAANSVVDLVAVLARVRRRTSALAAPSKVDLVCFWSGIYLFLSVMFFLVMPHLATDTVHFEVCSRSYCRRRTLQSSPSAELCGFHVANLDDQVVFLGRICVVELFLRVGSGQT